MGSEFDYWVYWNFFTITVSCNSTKSMVVYDWTIELPSEVSKSKSKSRCDWRSVSKSWCSAPDIYYCLTVTVLFLWGALSDERTRPSVLYAAGPCQRSLSRARVPWDSRPYFTVSDLRLPFSSRPTTLRVTVEVFDPASTRVLYLKSLTNEALL
jgi:hypothetical protein